MKRVLSLIIIVLLFQVVNSFCKRSEVYLLPENFGERALKHTYYLAEKIGARSAGTENEWKAAIYINDEFKKAKIKSNLESFEFESFELEKTDFRVGIKSYKLEQLGFNPYKDVRSFNGSVILFDNDHFLSDIRPSEVTEKVIISNNPQNYFQLMSMNPQLILYIDSASFSELIIQHDYNFTLEIEGRYKMWQSSNIVAFMGSKAEDAREIIISAHYDSYKTSPGADDNGSGVGVLLELAKHFKKLKIPDNFRIIFIAFGAEEAALVGSREYLKSHSKSLENCQLLINLDQVGGSDVIAIEMNGGVAGMPEKKGINQIPECISGRSGEGIESQWKLLEPLVMKPFIASNHPQWLVDDIKAIIKELDLKVTPSINLGSDQMVFTQAGIPSTGIAIFGNKVHSSFDTPDKVNSVSLRKAGEITAGVVLKAIERLKKY